MKTQYKTILTGVVLSLLAFQVLLLAILAFFPYVWDPGFSTLNANVYTFLAPLSAVFLLGLLYAWLIKRGAREACRSSRRFKRLVRFLTDPFRRLVSSIKTWSPSDSARSFRTLSRPRLLLVASIATSAILALVPYRPDLNPTGNLVGIDSPLYVTWISQMLARPIPQAIQYSFIEGLDGSRPLFLIVLYMVASLGASPSQIIEYLPMILAPLLSLSSYMFVRFGHGSASFAGLTALFTPLSFYIPVGLWGGYYANMAALIFAYLFLTILLLFSKSPSGPKYGGMCALSIALFLTHPWTWVLMVATSSVFAFSLWRETRLALHLRSMAGIIIAGAALDVIKSTVFATRTVAADLATKLPTAIDASSFWMNLVDGLLYTHSRLFGSWIILGIGALACFALRFKDWFERLVLLWVGVASIPFLILNSYDQTRIVYDLPISVLMATSMLFFLPLIGNRLMRWPEMIIVLILVVCANYTLQGNLLL